MNQEEQRFVEQLRQGEEQAYRRLYMRCYEPLCQAAWRYLQDRSEAEDVVSDVIARFWERRESLEVRVSVMAYLLAAVRNTCLNHLSRNRQRYTSFDNLPVDAAGDVRQVLDSEMPLDEMRLVALVCEAVDTLPAECRAVFCSSRFEDKSYAEIARDRGISVNTVKYHVKQALAILRKALGPYLAAALLIIYSDFKLFFNF
ncbi:MAG: RNA polymerase sigma-70 factor [Bacteroidales bacterium]|nr:RNA polymerase sigma-70 factor [Bacteroidales bacterium]